MKVAVGFKYLDNEQISKLVECNDCIIISDKPDEQHDKLSRQRLSYITNKFNRKVDPFVFDLEVEDLLRRFRRSPEFVKLYDFVRRLGSRAFMSFGLSASPFEVDFARSYLQWWIAKNILSKPISEVVFAYHPHSPFDLTLYYMARWTGIDVLSMKNFYSHPFYILSRNILDIDSYNLLESAIPAATKRVDEQRTIVHSHLKHVTRVVQEKDVWMHAKNLENERLASPTWVNNVIQLADRLAKTMPLTNRTNKRCSGTPDYNSLIGSLISDLIARTNKTQKLVFSADEDFIIPSKYAYFSFQVQPEATTEIFGGNYLEQIELLREFRSLVSEEIIILVRDHQLFATPHAYARPGDWEDTIKSIPNTVFSPLTSPSGTLVRNAMVVCSATGTCCLEANTVGIPAVYGGHTEFIGTTFSKHINSFEDSEDFMTWVMSFSNKNVNQSMQQFAGEFVDLLHPFVRYGSPYKDPVQFFGVSKVTHDCKFIEWYKE